MPLLLAHLVVVMVMLLFFFLLVLWLWLFLGFLLECGGGIVDGDEQLCYVAYVLVFHVCLHH